MKKSMDVKVQNTEKEVCSCKSGISYILNDVYKNIKIKLEIRSPNMKLLKDESCNNNFINTFEHIKRAGHTWSETVIFKQETDIKKYLFNNRYFELIFKTSKFVIVDGNIKLKPGNNIEISRKDIIKKHKDYVNYAHDIPLVVIMRISYGDKKCFHIMKFIHDLTDCFTISSYNVSTDK